MTEWPAKNKRMIGLLYRNEAYTLINITTNVISPLLWSMLEADGVPMFCKM